MPTLRRAACLALSAAVAAGCASFDPYGLVTRLPESASAPSASPVPAPAGQGLGEAGRLAALDFVWATVKERYYDPKMNGVDWEAARRRWAPQALAAASDEEFWDLLDRMAGELHDSHTRVESPRRARQVDQDESVTFGFSFAPLDGRLVVTTVNPESDAWWAGVRPGMRLVAIAGEPAESAYAKAAAQSRDGSTDRAKHLAALRRLLAGDAGSKADFEFARGDGSRLAATLARQPFRYPPRVTHRVLPSGFGYLRLTAWSPRLEGEMIRAIEAMKAAPGLVIDLRGNPGGSVFMVEDVAAQFFGGNVDAGRALTRSGGPVTFAFDWIKVFRNRIELQGTGAYAGPVAILLDAGSGSGSELFAAILRSQRRATIVGRESCGCLLMFLGYAAIPGGGRLAYSEVGFAFPDGSRVEGGGIAPDVAVPLATADLLAGRDRALEEAQRFLAGAAKAKSP